MSAAWYDKSHDGEGFLMELLADGRAIMYWFTYNGAGEQDWYIAAGEVDGRRIMFPELVSVTGGEFGPDYDPSKIEKTVAGSAAFTWTACDEGFMDWFIDDNHDRQELVRLSSIMGLDCGKPLMAPERQEAGLSGSWFDPSSRRGRLHRGSAESMDMVLVYWFSYGPQGKRRWFYGVGEIRAKANWYSMTCRPPKAASSAPISTRTPSPAVPGEPWNSTSIATAAPPLTAAPKKGLGRAS